MLPRTVDARASTVRGKLVVSSLKLWRNHKILPRNARHRRVPPRVCRRTPVPTCRALLFLCAAAIGMSLPEFGFSAVVTHDLVIITKLNDVDLGQWQGQRRRRRTEQHCVASSAHDNLFLIHITGDGPGGSFLMANGAAFLPYYVEYRDQGGGGFKQVHAGVPLLYQVGEANPFKCKNQKQRLRITVLGEDMIQVPAGLYTGTLTLMVTPI